MVQVSLVYIIFTNYISRDWDMFLDLVRDEGARSVISHDIDPFLNDREWNIYVCTTGRDPHRWWSIHIISTLMLTSLYAPKARILINTLPLSHINFDPDYTYT